MYDTLPQYPQHPPHPGPARAGRGPRRRRLRPRHRQGRRLLGHLRPRRHQPGHRHRQRLDGLGARWSASPAPSSAGSSAATASRKPTSPASRSRSPSTTPWSSTSRTSPRRFGRPSTSRPRAGPARCWSTSRATCSSRLCEFEYPESVDLRGYQPTTEGDPRQIERAAELIAQSERPVILAGHGVVHLAGLGRSWWSSRRRRRSP